MTLKEKFLPFVDWMDLQDDCTDRDWALRNASRCELIAEKFAIEFHSWMRLNDTQENAEKCFHYTDTDMLNAFKEEKGL